MLCNLSFLKRIFSECMNAAKVVPLLKSGSRFELINCRLISFLSCLSKVFKKIDLRVRLMNYLTKHFLLHPNQYGFYQGLSITHDLLDDMTTAYSNNEKMLYSFLFLLIIKEA